ncbi:protein kinase [Streptomyces ossamyceticus]|nr:protein kinase [Streptomyces ossamyceticus]
MQSEAPESGVGRVIADRYLLLNRLGSGGMGHVWLAHDQQLDCEVALKEIVFRDPGEEEQDRTTRVARARAEARHAAGLRGHPHVVTVHDVLEHDELPWIVMEYVPGAVDLRALVTRRGPLAPAECARIGLAVLDALTAGHERGVMHRDVKPANILLAPDRTGSPYARVLLTDYGISVQPDTQETRYTRSHMLVGTTGYLAPERAQGGPPTAAADLFSLGCTLYYAVEGFGPFDRDSGIAALTAVVLEEPRPVLRAGALEPLLAAMLTKDPVRRITAADTEAALAAIVTPRAHPRTDPDLRSQPQWASGALHTVEPEVLASRHPHETSWPAPTTAPENPSGWASSSDHGPAHPAPRSPDTRTDERRRHHRAKALLAGMATTLGLALLVSGIMYGLGNLPDLRGLGGGTRSGARPYGDAIGLTRALRNGDCVDADWSGVPFTDQPQLTVVDCGEGTDGQVMAVYEAGSAEDARSGGSAQCDRLTKEADGLLADTRGYAVVPTADGFDTAGQRVACLLLGTHGPVHGPIGEHRPMGMVFTDTATMQKRDCLDRLSDSRAKLVPCDGPHDEQVLAFLQVPSDLKLKDARREGADICQKEAPPKEYGYPHDIYEAAVWVGDSGWHSDTHFVVCTAMRQDRRTMEKDEP